MQLQSGRRAYLASVAGRNMSEKDRVDSKAIKFEVSHQTPLVGGSVWSLNDIMPSNISKLC